MSGGRYVVRLTDRELTTLRAVLLALETLLDEVPGADDMDKLSEKLAAAHNREVGE